jgi:hypothetical protein
MPIIRDSEIAAAAQSAGVRGDNIAIAVAIAIAESGGNTRAHNGTPPDNSYGLWQINMLGPLGPQRRAMLGISSNDALYDPNVNARAMFKISNGGTNWRPWTTYTSGRYRLFLQRGKDAVSNPAGGRNAPPDTGTLDNLGKAVGTLSSAETWQRVGMFLVGFILVVVALFKLTGDNKLSDTTKAIGKMVVTKGVVK